MRELVDDFLAAQRSPGTRASYASDLAIFLGWMAARRKHPLQAARPDIDRYRNWLAATIGPDGKPAANGRPRHALATVARKLSAVRALYTYLTERRVLAGSPAAGVKGPQVGQRSHHRLPTAARQPQPLGDDPHMADATPGARITALVDRADRDLRLPGHHALPTSHYQLRRAPTLRAGRPLPSPAKGS
jgi:hypothetical protein